MSEFECDRCGKDCAYSFDLCGLKDIYKTMFVSRLCIDCSVTANSFVNYYGEKKAEDIERLSDYLRSGEKSRAAELNAYSAMTNAGYMSENVPDERFSE